MAQIETEIHPVASTVDQQERELTDNPELNSRHFTWEIKFSPISEIEKLQKNVEITPFSERKNFKSELYQEESTQAIENMTPTPLEAGEAQILEKSA